MRHTVSIVLVSWETRIAGGFVGMTYLFIMRDAGGG